MRLVQTGAQVQGQVVNRAGEQAQNNASQRLLASINRVGQSATQAAHMSFEDEYNIAAKEAEKEASIDAVDAVGSGYEYDENDANTVYAHQFNTTANQTALLNLDTEIIQRTAEYAALNPDDPQGFQDALRDNLDDFSDRQGLTGEQKAFVSTQLVKSAKRYLPGMITSGIAKEKAKLTQSAVNNLTTNQNVALQHAYEGDLKGYQELSKGINEGLELAVSENYISATDAVDFKIQFDKRSNIQVADGGVTRGIEIGSLTGDFTGAINIVKKWYERTAGTGKLSPEELNKQRDTGKLSPEELNKRRDTGKFSPEELNKQRDAFNSRISKANKAWLKSQKENAKLVHAVQSYANYDKMDYKNKTDQKIAETVFVADKQTDISDPEVFNKAMTMAIDKNILPKSLISSVRRNMYSDYPSKVLAAVNFVYEMKDKSLSAAEQIPDKDASFAYKVKSLIDLGNTPIKAIADANEYYRQDSQERKQVFMSNIEDGQTGYKKKVNESFEDFKEGVDPNWVFDIEDNSAMRMDYSNLHDHYVTQTGDYDLATDLTQKKLKTIYGASYLSGDQKIEKYAPEKLLEDSDEPVKWLQESWDTRTDEALSYLESLGKDGVRKEDIIYQPSAETVKGERIWRLYVTNPDGTIQPVANGEAGYWKPIKGDTDYGKYQAGRQVELDANQAEYIQQLSDYNAKTKALLDEPVYNRRETRDVHSHKPDLKEVEDGYDLIAAKREFKDKIQNRTPGKRTDRTLDTEYNTGSISTYHTPFGR